MEKGQVRKQMDVADVQDKASWAKNRLEFLRNSFMSTRDLHLTADGLAGLCRIVEDVAGSLDEIVEAKIVMRDEPGKAGTSKGQDTADAEATTCRARREAKQLENWPDICRNITEIGSKMRVLDVYINEAEEMSPSETEEVFQALSDIDDALQGISGHVDTLMQLTEQA